MYKVAGHTYVVCKARVFGYHGFYDACITSALTASKTHTDEIMSPPFEASRSALSFVSHQ